VGFISYPIYAERVDILRVSFVNGVEPTPENMHNHLPLGRWIYMYLITREVELTEYYIKYRLSLPAIEGYGLLSAAQLAEMQARVESLHN